MIKADIAVIKVYHNLSYLAMIFVVFMALIAALIPGYNLNVRIFVPV